MEANVLANKVLLQFIREVFSNVDESSTTNKARLGGELLILIHRNTGHDSILKIVKAHHPEVEESWRPLSTDPNSI